MDIKIFVSNRIDKRSKEIPNPLFYNVRCGATYDKSHSNIPGDDTGENISAKRMSYCELTVHYWAWKNVKADYYGFCHYRRFISFSEREYPENSVGVVEYPFIDDTAIQRFRLDERSMRNEIEKYDIITHHGIPVGMSGDFKSVTDYCVKNPQGYKEKDIKILRDVVKERHPGDLGYFDEFFAGKENRWYNCYIMTAAMFDKYATWLFDILFELEKRLDITEYTQEQCRVFGVMAERLWGVFLLKIKRELKGNCKIAEKQVVFFKNTDPDPELPVPEDDKEPIVIRFQKSVAPMTWVTACSLLNAVTKSNTKYKIFFVTNRENDDAEKLLCKLHEKYPHAELQIVDTCLLVEKFIRVLGFQPDMGALIDFSILEAFRDFERITYLAPGTIVEQDITPIYDDINPRALAAAPLDYFTLATCYENESVSTFFKEQLGQESPWQYFNYSFCVLNLKKINESYTASSFVKMLGRQKFGAPFLDALNARLYQRTDKLDANWGMQADAEDFIKVHMRWFLPYALNEEALLAEEDPKVVIYSWYAAPWNTMNVGYSGDFWNLLRDSEYYERALDIYFSFRFSRIPTSTIMPVSSKPRQGLLALADRIFPKGTRRREFVKMLFPRGSKRRAFLKRLYEKFLSKK